MKNLLDIVLPNSPGSSSRRYLVASAIWLLVGVAFALLGAIAMVAPDFLPPLGAFGFGRLRPTHINLVIFGFLMNAFFGGLLYIVPTVCRTTLISERIGNFAVWFYNAVVVGALWALPHGYTQAREYAELPWILDIGVLISIFVLICLVFGTVAQRREKLLYVSVWYIGAGLIWSFFVYAVGNVVWQYPSGAWHGMNDQIVLWFYGHNVVGLVVTPQAIALAYYIIPRTTGKPIYSHTLSLFGFWALIVMYTHTGTHHLLQTPAPEWLKTLSVVNSIALIIPVFAFLTNVWIPLRERLNRIYASPAGKFVFAGTVWYFIVCLQGPFQSLPSVQRVTHYTQWVIAHAHIALMGFGGMIAIGAVYFILPRVSGKRLYSTFLADAHFWLHLLGTLGIFTSLTFAGLIQGEAWLNGEVVYRVLPELRIYFIVRGISGVLVVVGALLFIYNVAMTVRGKAGELDAEELEFGRPPRDLAEAAAEAEEVAA